MLPWSLREVAALVNGRLEGGGDSVKITGVSHDTRSLKKGDLFVAIRGPRFDGHRFLGKAARKGAKAALVSRPQKASGMPQVVVKDATRALGDLGRAQRLQWNGPVVAVTGSVGKTTVKDMAAHLISGSRRVLKTEGNLNNQFGLPLTLLRLNRGHEAAVVELGINHPGEMGRLSEIARPDVAVVTAIGEAHLGFFRGQKHLAAEKLKVGAGMREGGTMVLNADDPFLKAAGRGALTFGLGAGTVRAKNIRTEDLQTRFTLSAGGFRRETALSMPGVHNVRNALAAVAAGWALGIPMEALAGRLRTFKPQAAMRMEAKRIRGVLFLNDAYNASPTSMEAALRTFGELKTAGRKIAVLGDMLELGAFSPESHRKVLRQAFGAGFDLLVLVGGRMRGALRALGSQGTTEAACFGDAAQAGVFLKERLKKGDAVLLKGSRAMGMEKILEMFQKK